MTVWFRRRSPDCLHVALPYFTARPVTDGGALERAVEGQLSAVALVKEKKKRDTQRPEQCKAEGGRELKHICFLLARIIVISSYHIA